MTSFKKYFSHHFKETLMRAVVLTVLAMLLAVTFITFSSYTYNYYPTAGYETHFIAVSVNGSIVVLGVIAGILATIIPILELSGFKNRRNMDSLLVLPVSRSKMALAHYINGIIEIVFINAVRFVIGAIKMIPYTDVYSALPMLPFYALLILASLALYSLFFFVFMQGNTIADGVIFMFAYSVIGMLVLAAIEEGTHVRYSEAQFSYCSPYSPIFYLTNFFERWITPTIRYKAEVGPSELINQIRGTPEWVSEFTFYLVLWSVIGAIAVAGYLYFFAKQRPERIGGISSSPFGYMTLIPIFALSCIVAASISTIGEIVLILIATVIGYIIYRRSVRLKLPDLISIGCIALILVFRIIF